MWTRVLNARRHRSGNYSATGRIRRASRRVLNARRHRSGNYVGGVLESSETLLVLNARRHRSGNYPWNRRPDQRADSAQRPKVSERELLADLIRENVLSDLVLNVRRHRSGNYMQYTHIGSSQVDGAQRPKASERELPETTPVPELSARECSTPEGIGAGITDPE